MRDLAETRFGKLVAKAPTDQRENGCVVWRCACDCGNECEVRSDYLVRGRVVDCGCEGSGRRRRMRDLAGERFGRLVVESRAGTANGRATWTCRCDCGNTCEATTYQLTSGRKTSCGCASGRRAAGSPDFGHSAASIRCGKRFGHLVAVDERPSAVGGEPEWRCVCDCNRIVQVSAADLLSGAATSCGLCNPPAS